MIVSRLVDIRIASFCERGIPGRYNPLVLGARASSCSSATEAIVVATENRNMVVMVKSSDDTFWHKGNLECKVRISASLAQWELPVPSILPASQFLSFRGSLRYIIKDRVDKKVLSF